MAKPGKVFKTWSLSLVPLVLTTFVICFFSIKALFSIQAFYGLALGLGIFNLAYYLGLCQIFKNLPKLKFQPSLLEIKNKFIFRDDQGYINESRTKLLSQILTHHCQRLNICLNFLICLKPNPLLGTLIRGPATVLIINPRLLFHPPQLSALLAHELGHCKEPPFLSLGPSFLVLVIALELALTMWFLPMLLLSVITYILFIHTIHYREYRADTLSYHLEPQGLVSLLSSLESMDVKSLLPRAYPSFKDRLAYVKSLN